MLSSRRKHTHSEHCLQRKLHSLPPPRTGPWLITDTLPSLLHWNHMGNFEAPLAPDHTLGLTEPHFLEVSAPRHSKAFFFCNREIVHMTNKVVCVLLLFICETALNIRMQGYCQINELHYFFCDVRHSFSQSSSGSKSLGDAKVETTYSGACLSIS